MREGAWTTNVRKVYEAAQSMPAQGAGSEEKEAGEAHVSTISSFLCSLRVIIGDRASGSDATWSETPYMQICRAIAAHLRCFIYTGKRYYVVCQCINGEHPPS
jgi:hypothetical protein